SLEINLELFDSKIKNQSDLILIDIRDDNSFKLNHIKNFINILEENIFNYLNHNLKDKNTEIFVLCYKGIKSLNLVKKLRELGYKKSYSIQGGFDLLKEKYDVSIIHIGDENFGSDKKASLEIAKKLKEKNIVW
ncbi:MAG: rhodanese-like domain-containing protein, partial [Candidatus Sericytochromatia bacterium]